MSEQNTTTAPETNGTAKKAKLVMNKEMFPTLEEAQAAKPETDNEAARIYFVKLADDIIGYTWGRGVYDAVCNAAHDAGYTAGVAEPKKGGGPVTKEKIASKLAEFTDEELAALGLSRKKPKTQKV